MQESALADSFGWSPWGSTLPFDARGDAGANVLRLRIHGRQERFQAAPRLVKLVHQRQHNGEAVLLDAQLVVQLADETHARHIGWVKQKVLTVPVGKHPSLV